MSHVAKDGSLSNLGDIMGVAIIPEKIRKTNVESIRISTSNFIDVLKLLIKELHDEIDRSKAADADLANRIQVEQDRSIKALDDFTKQANETYETIENVKHISEQMSTLISKVDNNLGQYILNEQNRAIEEEVKLRDSINKNKANVIKDLTNEQIQQLKERLGL